MTPLERAARALHKDYIEERIRNGVKPSDLPSWDDLGSDGRLYFTHKVRAILTAIREPSDYMAAAGTLPDREPLAEDVWKAMIDAALAEGE